MFRNVDEVLLFLREISSIRGLDIFWEAAETIERTISGYKFKIQDLESKINDLEDRFGTEE